MDTMISSICIAIIVIAASHRTQSKPIVTEYENGTDTSFDREQRLKYPWFGRLPDGECGGTLITPRHVLTKANCVEYYPSAMEELFEYKSHEYSMTFKTVDKCVISQFEEKFRIVHVEIHPEYYKGPLDDYVGLNDIAVLTLETEVTSIEPIVLPADESPIVHESNALLIGFGETIARQWNDPPNMHACHLQQAYLDILSSKECMQQTYATFSTKLALYLGDYILCAGRMEGGVGLCNGDGGSPLFIQKNGQYIIKGVASYSFGCSIKNLPGIYMNVAHYLPWLKQVAPGIKQEGFQRN